MELTGQTIVVGVRPVRCGLTIKMAHSAKASVSLLATFVNALLSKITVSISSLEHKAIALKYFSKLKKRRPVCHLFISHIFMNVYHFMS
jgi:hypothetical protein